MQVGEQDAKPLEAPAFSTYQMANNSFSFSALSNILITKYHFC
jgi:hypothetical protein